MTHSLSRSSSTRLLLVVTVTSNSSSTVVLLSEDRRRAPRVRKVGVKMTWTIMMLLTGTNDLWLAALVPGRFVAIGMAAVCTG